MDNVRIGPRSTAVFFLQCDIEFLGITGIHLGRNDDVQRVVVCYLVGCCRYFFQDVFTGHQAQLGQVCRFVFIDKLHEVTA